MILTEGLDQERVLFTETSDLVRIMDEMYGKALGNGVTNATWSFSLFVLLTLSRQIMHSKKYL